MTFNLEFRTNLADESLFSSDSPEQILIVDDEELVRRFHFDCLSPRYSCFEAASAEEALEILDKERIDLVITDWVMSGMSGTMLLRRVIKEFPDTSVIMITGIDHPERSIDALRYGAFDYIMKPSSPEILEFTVERALRQKDIKIKARQYKIDFELQTIELVKQKAEIENLQEQLKNAEEAASTLKSLTELSHELNNPLGYISGNLQILEQCFKDLNRLMEIYEASEIPQKDLCEIEKQKQKINYEKMNENVNSLISDCVEGTERISRFVRTLRSFSELDRWTK